MFILDPFSTLNYVFIFLKSKLCKRLSYVLSECLLTARPLIQAVACALVRRSSVLFPTKGLLSALRMFMCVSVCDYID